MLAVLSVAVALQSESSLRMRVEASELIGLSPAAVAARLGASADPRPDQALRILEAGRVVDIYPSERFRRLHSGPGTFCLTGFPEVVDPNPPSGSDRQNLGRRDQGWYVFEDGRLASIHPEPIRLYRAGPVTRQSMRELVHGPKPLSSFVTAPGRLPLSDGVAVRDRLPPPPENLGVESLCGRLPDRAPMRSGDLGTDIAWALVGLPFLAAKPFTDAANARDDREGAELGAILQPGRHLAGGLEAAIGDRRNVRILRDAEDPGYAVVSIRLGPGADNVDDIALVGVRDDVVIWSAERRAAELLGLRTLVCLDRENRPGRHRTGCSSTGVMVG